MRSGNETVSVCRVSDNYDFDIPCGVIVDSFAGLDEYLPVILKQIIALHTRALIIKIPLGLAPTKSAYLTSLNPTD
jgi:hypothetical protein